MSYLVLESHLSYAVVLDENGRFLKVANLQYEVGQTLDQVIEMELPPVQTGKNKRHLRTWAAMAACFCVAVLGAWQMVLAPYGTVRMSINPDVKMTVNRVGYVTELEGLNQDGRDLIRGVKTLGKQPKELSDELADRAVEMGYLQEGGRISLTVDSKDEKWKTATEELLVLELTVHLNDTVQVITVATGQESPAPDAITIPLDPDDDDDDRDNIEDDRDDGWDDDTDEDDDDSDDDDDDSDSDDDWDTDGGDED